MPWELLAIWAITIVTVTWFVRDERRQVADRVLARQAAYYAHAPKYRHISAERHAAALPPKVPGGLTEAQRKFLNSLNL